MWADIFFALVFGIALKKCASENDNPFNRIKSVLWVYSKENDLIKKRIFICSSLAGLRVETFEALINRNVNSSISNILLPFIRLHEITNENDVFWSYQVFQKCISAVHMSWFRKFPLLLYFNLPFEKFMSISLVFLQIIIPTYPEYFAIIYSVFCYKCHYSVQCIICWFQSLNCSL